MKQRIGILLAFVIAISVAVALRCVVFGIYSIPHDTQRPMLMAGDRVLVSKWAYGMRLPWWKEGERKHTKSPQQGDWVGFSVHMPNANTHQNGIGCLMACPGDTVWTGPQFRVSPVRDYSRGCIWPLVVPKKGETMELAPWNISLYARTINLYEGVCVDVKADRLMWNKRSYRRFRFRKNYYWVYSGNPANLQDSRTMGFLPEEAITGQATTLLYSLDGEKPWYCRMRTDRTFSPLGGKP